MEKNYIIRKDELRKKVRRDFHRPTRAERDPKAYSRKEKHRTFWHVRMVRRTTLHCIHILVVIRNLKFKSLFNNNNRCISAS